MTAAERARRLAENEAFFREVNESVGRIAATHGVDSHLYEFLCECCDEGCVELIQLTLGEYESLRARGDRFAIVPGHEDVQIERVVEQGDRYGVVEKVGEGSAVALELDPRARR